MAGSRTLEQLMNAVRSFQESRILLTAVELDVFGAVGAGAAAPDVARAAGTDPRATEMLLGALAALGALEKREGRFHLTEASAALARSREGFLHMAHLWNTWSTLTECVRRGTSLAEGGVEARDPAWTRAFIQSMHFRARPQAAGVAAQVGAAGARRMLDVGGGPGTFALAFAQAEPGLRAEILDLEPVLPMALENIREAGLEDRVTVRAGDLTRDAFGEGYDLVLLSAICHMLDPEGNRDLVGRCAKALAPGGRLVIREFLLDPDRAGPPVAAVFALNMLVGTPRGAAYTEAECRSWMEAAGLGAFRRLGPDLLVAVKSPGP